MEQGPIGKSERVTPFFFKDFNNNKSFSLRTVSNAGSMKFTIYSLLTKIAWGDGPLWSKPPVPIPWCSGDKIRVGSCKKFFRIWKIAVDRAESSFLLFKCCNIYCPLSISNWMAVLTFLGIAAKPGAWKIFKALCFKLAGKTGCPSQHSRFPRSNYQEAKKAVHELSSFPERSGNQVLRNATLLLSNGLRACSPNIRCRMALHHTPLMNAQCTIGQPNPASKVISRVICDLTPS